MKILDLETRAQLIKQWNKAHSRILFLDYDGTLAAFAPLPELAAPTELVLDVLKELTEDERNTVFIISGRDSDTLERWLGHLPLQMIAEHGAKMKLEAGEWENETSSREWKEGVKVIMDSFKTEGTFIEDKDFSIAYHYRNVTEANAEQRATALYEQLHDLVHQTPQQALHGNKVIEVRNRGINKGEALLKMIAGKHFDLILAIGDDRTDEDMFRALEDNTHAITIKVGAEASCAHYNVPVQTDVLPFLEQLINSAFI